MVLTTVANVAAYLQTTIDGSSTPTDTTVTQWITWAEAEIERRTGQKFESTAITNRVIDLDRYNVTVNLYGS
jgi:protein-disulfide isomerase-like protein with CxxC motif